MNKNNKYIIIKWYNNKYIIIYLIVLHLKKWLITKKQYYMKYGFEEHIAYTGTKFIVLDVSKSRVSYKTKIKLKTKKQKRVNTLSKIVWYSYFIKIIIS